MLDRDDTILLDHESPLIRKPGRRELIANLIFFGFLLAVLAPTGLMEPDAFLQSLGILVAAAWLAGLGLMWMLRDTGSRYGTAIPPPPQLTMSIAIYLTTIALPIGAMTYWGIGFVIASSGPAPRYVLALTILAAVAAVLAPPVELLYRVRAIKAAKAHKANSASNDGTHQRVAELERLANHDALTGLPNRRCFELAMAQLSADDQEFAVMFIDFDKFKPINDEYGHAFGDEFLKSISMRIRSLVRDGDLVARLGGDEFAVLIKGADARASSTHLAERFTEAMKEPVLCAEVELLSSASVGIAVGRAGLDDLERVVHHADMAMYEAKRTGGAGFCVAA